MAERIPRELDWGLLETSEKNPLLKQALINGEANFLLPENVRNYLKFIQENPPQKNAGISILTNPYQILEAQSQAYTTHINQGKDQSTAIELSQAIIREIYWGKIVNDPVEFTPEIKVDKEPADQPAGVAILCKTEENQFVLLRQYRHGAQKWFLTIPMGQNELSDPKKAAIEEIRQEAGAEIIEPLIELGDITPDPSFMSEKDRLYFGKVKITEEQKDKTEGIESVVLLTYQKLMDAAVSGTYIDERGKKYDATDSYLQTAIFRAQIHKLI